MDSNKHQASSSSTASTSSSSFWDHLFSPRTSMSSSSVLNSIFPPPSSVVTSKVNSETEVDRSKFQPSDSGAKEFQWSDKSGKYNGSHESTHQEACYLGSTMIYHGSQQHYTPQPHDHADSPVSYYTPKQASREDDDPYGIDTGAATRGNWWLGSLYY